MNGSAVARISTSAEVTGCGPLQTHGSSASLICLPNVLAASEYLVAETGLHRAVEGAVATLHRHIALDRVYLVRKLQDASGFQLYSESCGPGVTSLRGRLHEQQVSDAFRSVCAHLLAGQAYRSSLPGPAGPRALLESALGTRRALLLPVTVDGSLWGGLGFDDGSRAFDQTQSPVKVNEPS